jgi:hypothetical protein
MCHNTQQRLFKQNEIISGDSGLVFSVRFWR